MANLQKYLGAIQSFYGFKNFENMSEMSKKKFLQDLNILLISKVGASDFTSYIAGLNSGDIEPFNGIIKSLINSDIKTGGNSDPLIINGVIATLATNAIWNFIYQKYVDEDKLNKALEGKDINGITLKYFTFNEEAGVIDVISKLNEKGINVTQISMDEIDNSPEYYDDLYEFYKLLSSDNLKNSREKSLETFAGGVISTFVDSMMKTLKTLYSTGFSGFPQEGLMILNGNNSPILRIDYQKNVVTHKAADNNIMYDYKIVNSIISKYPALGNYYMGNPESENEDVIPNISYFLNNVDKPFVCYKLHLQFQSANARFSKGITSISNWVKETKGTNLETWLKEKNNGKNTLEKWSYVEDWYKWSLKKIFLNALLQYNENGRELQGNTDEANIVLHISEALTNSLKNVIVVSDRDNKKFSNMELRISANSDLDSTLLIEDITRQLNAGTGNTIKVIEKGQNDYNVKILNVVFNEKAANSSTLFAGDVIDRFIESGNIPSWSHALIGKKEDGSLFFWDGFMDPSKAGPANRCYTLYAASRSGKGVMTSTLVASALCDKRQVFYTDGKPENGATMGMVAWKDGKEAYVFDGQATGSKPFDGNMEQYTKGLRTEGEIGKFLNELPRELFNDPIWKKEDHLKFLGVMRYLKSMMLCAETIIGRASNKLPIDNWQIWIFDEMTSMSSNEISIRKIFAKYCDKKEILYTNTAPKGEEPIFGSLKSGNQEKLDPDSIKYDAGAKYLSDWVAWNSSLKEKILNANVISLGKADTNLIFIFQEPSWIPVHVKCGGTIASIVKTLKSTKIVGRGGIVDGAGTYGDGTIKAHWKAAINIEGAGNWAMSHGEDIRKSQVTLFKPFNIWTVPLNNGEMGDINSIPPEQRTRYFDGYVTKLLGAFNVSPSEVLQSAYDYANNAVSTLGLLNGPNSSTVKDYIYDCSNLVVISTGSLDDTQREMMGVNKEEFHIESEEEGSEPDIFGGHQIFNPDSEIVSPIEKPEVAETSDSIINEGIFIPDEDGVDNSRLEQVFNMFDSRYMEIINKIEKSKDNLLFIPKKESNEPKFKSLQSELLRNFSGKYLTEKNKFFESLKSRISDIELRNAAYTAYENKFNIDFTRLRDIISGATFIIDSSEITSPNSETSETDILNPEPVKDEGRTSPTHKGTSTNGRRIESQIDCDDIELNTDDIDSISNVKATDQLTSLIIKDIKTQFGGVRNIESIAITAGGCLVINEYTYLPQLGDKFMNSLGAAIRADVENGQLYKIVNIGKVVRSVGNDIFDLSIETPKVANSSVFKNEIGATKGYRALFNSHDNLQVIHLPDQELTRDNPVEEKANNNGGGLGSRLAGLFGFGGNKKSNNYVPNPANDYSGSDTIDRIMDSAPVRVMTGALGWTLGCKAVVVAATLFGPWGLLFGAFAMAGAYNNYKANKNNNNNGYNNGNRSRNSNNSRNNNRNNSRNNNRNNSRRNDDYDE